MGNKKMRQETQQILLSSHREDLTDKRWILKIKRQISWKQDRKGTIKDRYFLAGKNGSNNLYPGIYSYLLLFVFRIILKSAQVGHLWSRLLE